MSLQRQAKIKDDNGQVPVDIYDIHTKAKVFTGNQCDAAAYIGIPQGHLAAALRKKCKIKKLYAVRIAKQPTI